jgi:hypothetical protein
MGVLSFVPANRTSVLQRLFPCLEAEQLHSLTTYQVATFLLLGFHSLALDSILPPRLTPARQTFIPMIIGYTPTSPLLCHTLLFLGNGLTTSRRAGMSRQDLRHRVSVP